MAFYIKIYTNIKTYKDIINNLEISDILYYLERDATSNKILGNYSFHIPFYFTQISGKT